MTFKDIVAQLLERGNAMQSFWGFYITISLGMLAFFGNARRTKRLPYVAALLSIAFVAFAIVNCDGMTDIAAQRRFFYSQLRAAADADISSSATSPHVSAKRMVEEFAQVAEPPRPEHVRRFHIGVDIAVLIAIWFLVLWREKTDPCEQRLAKLRELIAG